VYFDNQEWCDSTTVFSLGFYPNPLNTHMPLLAVTAYDDQVIYDLFMYAIPKDYILWDGWDYKIYQQKSKRLLGKFNHDSDWGVNLNEQMDLSEDATRLKQGKVYEMIDHESGLSEEAIQELLLMREARAAEIRAFCNFKEEVPKIKYHIYPSTERKGLLLHNTDQIHLNFRSYEAYAVHNAEFEQTPYELDNELLIRHMMNPTRINCLQRGLGIYFTENWQGAGYQRLAKLLHESDNMVPLSELIDNSLFVKESEYVMSAMAASFVDFLIRSCLTKTKYAHVD